MLGVGIIRRDSCVVNYSCGRDSGELVRHYVRPHLLAGLQTISSVIASTHGRGKRLAPAVPVRRVFQYEVRRPAGSISSSSPPPWSTCSVVWSSPKRSCSIASIARRAAWQSLSAPTSTCADSAGKPLVISHTCRSCTSTTPGCADERRADRPRVEALGRGLQEHAPGGLHERDAGVDHQRRRSAARRAGRRVGSRSAGSRPPRSRCR